VGGIDMTQNNNEQRTYNLQAELYYTSPAKIAQDIGSKLKESGVAELNPHESTHTIQQFGNHKQSSKSIQL
jgi:hypothetical protein